MSIICSSASILAQLSSLSFASRAMMAAARGEARRSDHVLAADVLHIVAAVLAVAALALGALFVSHPSFLSRSLVIGAAMLALAFLLVMV